MELKKITENYKKMVRDLMASGKKEEQKIVIQKRNIQGGPQVVYPVKI